MTDFNCNLGAFFAAHSAAKNRAIRSNSSQSAESALLRDFRFYPLRAGRRNDNAG
jgi:hypothetical protein